ncbi:stalk domain-containing protein [Paenibacillus albidus]|uniref:stalk domain-containing protein n=1 Tax=Paenibacillus albidus TaxID=2041023 RepID=UPI0020351B2B|nr:stalk domain-containing protein [Paenibacillus albidus]
MSKKKLMISAAAGIILVSSFSAGAYAATKFKLIVNGKTSSADVKVIDGSTYVPLKAVAELLGATVKFENSTKTVTITGQSGAAETPSTTQTSNPSSKTSRTNPAAIGTEVDFKVEDFLSPFEGRVGISEVIRGDKAWSLIKEANSFNSAPEAGHEYILAKVNISITKNTKADASVDVSPVNFTLVSTSGTEYKSVSIVTPEPKLRTSIYVGSSHSGWAVFQVKTSDLNPLITYGREFDGSGGTWFKTN